MASSTVRTFTDPDAYHAAIRYAHAEGIITHRGDYRAAMTLIRLDRVSINRSEETLPRITYSATDPELYLIAFDGEMVVVDGRFYQVQSDGRITEPPDSAPVPFAVVTTFRPLRRVPVAAFMTFDGLTKQLDEHRRSDNLFFAVRLDGRFAEIHTRVACKAEAGVPLDQATAHQAEFTMKDVTGTIVGFWSPPYARSINVAGWHLHFLTDDRTGGGHLLGCRGQGLESKLQDLDDLRLAIPETAQFLHADLTQIQARHWTRPSARIEGHEHHLAGRA